MNKLKIFLLFVSALILYNCSNEAETDDVNAVPLCVQDHEINKRQEQITTVPLFEPCDALNLFVLVDLSNCFTDDWECAVNNAIAAYNALPGDVSIGMTLITDESQLPEGESVNVEIDCDGINAIGSTSRRKSADDVSEITLNQNVLNVYPCGAPTCCQLQKTVMHELGHALGLGHTHGGTNNAEWIPGTPMGEANSIMNTTVSEDCNGGCEFTPGDIAALGILYDSDPCAACPEIADPCDCSGASPCSCPNVAPEGFDFCEECVQEYDLILVPGNTICAGEIAKIFISPIPNSSLNPTYEWSFERAVTGSSHGVAASFIGNLESHKPIGGICVTIKTDCGVTKLCESVHVIDCEKEGDGFPGGPK